MPVEGYRAISGNWTLLTATVIAAPNPPVSLGVVTPGTPGSKQATASWGIPADNGSPITSYTPALIPAPSIPLPTLISATSTSLVISGLNDGVAYTLQLTANNAIGSSAPAVANFTADSASTGVPAAPVNLKVTTPGTAGSKVATATWTAPANGGSAITGYVTTLTGTHATLPTLGAGAVSASLTGLTDNTNYTFTVAAVNANGTGPASTFNFKSDPASITGARFPGDPGKGKIRLGSTTTGQYTIDNFDSFISTRGPITTPSAAANPLYTYHSTLVRGYNPPTSSLGGWGPNWSFISTHISAGRIPIFSWLNGLGSGNPTNGWTLDQLANDLGTGAGGTTVGNAINTELASINTTALTYAPHAIWFSFYHEPEDNWTTPQQKTDYRNAFRRIALAITASNVTWVGPIYMSYTFNETKSLRDWKLWNPDWDDVSKSWKSPCYDIDGIDIYNPPIKSPTMQSWAQLISFRQTVMARDAAPVRPFVVCEYGTKSIYNQTVTPDSYFNETIKDGTALQNGDGGCVGLIGWNYHGGAEVSGGDTFSTIGDPTGGKSAAWRYISKDIKTVTTVP